MRNIVVVSMNKDLAVAIADKIAKILSLSFINADDEVDVALVGGLDFPLEVTKLSMANIERQILMTLSDRDDSVISIQNGTFLANENYKIFQKSLKILVKIDENEKISQNLQKLLEKYCDVTIREKDIDFHKLITLLRG